MALYKLAKSQKAAQVCTIAETRPLILCATRELVMETRCNASRQHPRNVWDYIENKHLIHRMDFNPSSRLPECHTLPAMSAESVTQGKGDRFASSPSPPLHRNIWDSLDGLVSAHACRQIDPLGRDNLPSASIARLSKLRHLCDVSGGEMMKPRRVTKKRKRNPDDDEATQAISKKRNTAR